jgi:hypothetical protein
MIGCIFNPGACLEGAAQSILGLFPFGVIGAAFTAGLIVGAILGKWGVGALLTLVVAVRVGTRDEFTGEVPDPDPKPERVPKPKVPRKSGTPGKGRKYDSDTNTWL